MSKSSTPQLATRGSSFGALASAVALALLWTGGAHAQQCTAAGINQTCTNSITLSGGAIGIVDSGTLTVSNTATGTITGSTFGINAADTANVTNFGTITGGVFGIDATNAANIINFGTISGDISISASTSNVTENMGTISGSVFGISANTAAVNNSGSISAGTFGILATTATVSNSGAIAVNAGGTGINATNTATVTNSGTISGGAFGVFANNAADLTNSGTISGSTAGISAGSGDVTNTGIIVGGSGVDLGVNSAVFDAGTIIGNGGTAINFATGTNTLTLEPGFVITGKVIGTGSDVFQLGGTGTAAFDLGLIGPSQQYQGFSTFNKVGSSTWTVTGTSLQPNFWEVQNGTLVVNGDLSTANGITVDGGGILGGIGTVSNLTVSNGGILAPGLPSIGSLHVAGYLSLASAASYLVQVSPLAASGASVNGTALVAGTLIADGTGGAYTIGQKYAVLTASGGLTGTFAGVTVQGSFGSTRPILAYDAGDAFLVLAPAVLGSQLPAGAPINVTNVAHAIDAANFGTPPLAFQNLFNLPPPQLQNALTQLSGEANMGAQAATFQLTNEFLSLLVDTGNDHGGTDFRNRAGLAQPRANVSELSEAIAPVPQWSVWSAGYGSTSNTDGDPGGLGSHDLAVHTSGFAVGLDDRISGDTTLGFALAGGGTSWSLSQGLGGGRSDVFQAGLYGSRTFGAAYLSGALAYGSHWFSTSRSITVDGLGWLNGSFVGQSFSGRLEGGYHLTSWTPFQLTPYVAIQAQSLATLAYSESAALGGSPFGLAFDAHTATAVRGEVGSWVTKAFHLASGGEFDISGRLGWAHDWQNSSQLAATFEDLPAASFFVNGATSAPDLLLLSNAAEWRWRNGWSFLVKLDGELAASAQRYRGTAQLRYTW